jgi:hypothetical protein
LTDASQSLGRTRQETAKLCAGGKDEHAQEQGNAAQEQGQVEAMPEGKVWLDRRGGNSANSWGDK